MKQRLQLGWRRRSLMLQTLGTYGKATMLSVPLKFGYASRITSGWYQFCTWGSIEGGVVYWIGSDEFWWSLNSSRSRRKPSHETACLSQPYTVIWKWLGVRYPIRESLFEKHRRVSGFYCLLSPMSKVIRWASWNILGEKSDSLSTQVCWMSRTENIAQLGPV